MSENPLPVTAYKDRMFIHLFSDKNRLLQLYNAVRGTHYENPEDIDVNTLENVLFMNMKNDLSFTFHEELSLYEHQSSMNPNMPLRGLLYIARLYEKLTKGMGIYSTRLIPLPNPNFVVFYNGLEEMPPECIMRLSDAYQIPSETPLLDFQVRIININYKENMEFLDKCPILKEYSYFVDLVRNYRQSLPLQEAIRQAIIISKENNVLKDYLEQHGSEVENMLMTEYSREMDIAVNRREAEEDGERRGELKGKIESIFILLSDYKIPKMLERRIRAEKDTELLNKWMKAAAKASSLQEFRELAGLTQTR